MKKYTILISVFIFFFCIANSSAQDLIVKKDGNKIFCHIVEIDSNSIFYLRPAQKNISVISKVEVQTYYTAKPPGRKGNLIADSTSNRQELLIVKLAAGFANPIGDFGSKDFESETSGLANSGFLLSASLILKFSKHFGFSCDYRYQKNAVDNDVVQQAYSSRNSPGVSLSTQTTHWLSHGFFGGLYFEAPLKEIKKLSLDFSLLAGLPEFESPELTITGTQNAVTMTLVQNSGKTSAPAFVGKMGLRYKFETVALNFGVSYFTAKPSFSGVLIQGSNGLVDYAKFQQRISSLNIEAGISFLLFH